MALRNLTAGADFAADIVCDHWKRKEEKSVIPRFQFSVSCSDGSTSSIGSVSSSNLCDDALSSFSSSSSSSSLSSTSSLLSQSEPHQQPPIKKGLSKFYQGKSRTFTTLSDVKCIEDLAKGENNYRKKDSRISLSPKAIISKKVGRSSLASLVSKADSQLEIFPIADS